MKKLYAKGPVLMGIILFWIPDVLLCIEPLLALLKNDLRLAVSWMPMTVWYVGVTVYFGRIQYMHWIKYGDEKVIVRRVSKICVDGRPTGKWKSREDSFGLEEIEAYGLSKQILGHYVECHRCTSYRWPAEECFFQLKNGKVIGCEIGFYPRRARNEFFQYLYEKTGILFQGNDQGRIY